MASAMNITRALTIERGQGCENDSGEADAHR